MDSEGHKEERSAETPKQRAEPNGDFSAFWEHPATQRAQEMIDIWASVRQAVIIERTLPPTIDAILGREIQQNYPSFLDEMSGLIITEWNERYASITGPILIKSSVKNLFAEPVLVYLSVEEILMRTPYYGIYVEVLIRRYPRTGPYELATVERPDAKREEHVSKWERWAIWAIRDHYKRPRKASGEETGVESVQLTHKVPGGQNVMQHEPVAEGLPSTKPAQVNPTAAPNPRYGEDPDEVAAAKRAVVWKELDRLLLPAAADADHERNTSQQFAEGESEGEMP